MLACCYAVGGARVNGLDHQIKNYFELDIGQKPECAPWNAADILLITWVGINDCAWRGDVNSRMKLLMNAHQHLFNLGARNFLFINLPTSPFISWHTSNTPFINIIGSQPYLQRVERRARRRSLPIRQ